MLGDTIPYGQQFFECNKHSNKPRANLISILINSLIASDAPIRLAKFVSVNQSSVNSFNSWFELCFEFPVKTADRLQSVEGFVSQAKDPHI